MTIDGYCTLGIDREYDLTPAALLAALDRARVDRAVIAPPDRQLAVFNREGNDNMRRASRTTSGRLIPACSVNPWFGDAALEEFRRAAADGARMLVLHPAVQGFTAADELVYPLLEASARERLPVYIHTGPPGSATPWQIVELAERFPEADFIMGHCGATDFWNDIPDAARAARNLWLESSLARPFHFARYMDLAGSARGIVGSWAPLNDLVFEWHQMRRFLRPEVLALAGGPNLQALLEKRGPL